MGLSFSYAEQPSPNGLAQAFVIGRSSSATMPWCSILGDNIFYGAGLADSLLRSRVREPSAPRSSRYHVQDPGRYGVVELDARGPSIGIEEKPARPKSNLRRHRPVLLR